MENSLKKEHSTFIKVILGFFKITIPITVIVAGVLCAWYLMQTKPKSKRLPPPRQAKLVEFVRIEPADIPIKINAMGTVMAAREVNLTAQVSGKIIELNPELIQGGTFQKDQMLVKIEPDDYELLVEQAETQVAIAQSSLKLEQGSQALAIQEHKLLEGVVAEEDKELLLRKPQLISAQSSLRAAQAKLKQSKINLGRTRIVTPFNSVVKTKAVELGTRVMPSTPLVTLIGADEYWITVMLHVDQLKWVDIPLKEGQAGSKVKIFNSSAWGDGTCRTGEVIRLYPYLETNGRMAQLLVSVKDPLALKPATPPNALLIGSYVRVEIQGKTMESAYQLDRGLLHGNDHVRLLNSDNSLDIRQVEVAYRGENEVILSGGIGSEDRIITTELAAPVKGMALRLHSKAPGPK